MVLSYLHKFYFDNWSKYPIKTPSWRIPGSQDKFPFMLSVKAEVSLHTTLRQTLEVVDTFTNHCFNPFIFQVVNFFWSVSKTSKTPLRI